MIALNVSEIAANYETYYLLAGAPETDNWYRKAHSMVYEIAQFYGIKARVVAGMVAVTSPMTKWEWHTVKGVKYPNLDNVVAIIHGVSQGHTFEKIQSNVTGFPANVQKAITILKTGRVFPSLRGEKVTNFFSNIMRPWSKLYVTIDQWMHRAALDSYIGKVESTRLTPKYDIFRQALLIVAEKHGIEEPQMLQAIIWKVAREELKTNNK